MGGEESNSKAVSRYSRAVDNKYVTAGVDVDLENRFVKCSGK